MGKFRGLRSPFSFARRDNVTHIVAPQNPLCKVFNGLSTIHARDNVTHIVALHAHGARLLNEISGNDNRENP